MNMLLLLLMPLLAVNAIAQKTITEAEYQIDGGDPLPLIVDESALTYSGDQAFTIELDSSNLSIGPHEVSVRFKDSEGVWSYWDRSNMRQRWFRVTGKQYLTAAEWYIDEDPGAGNGTPIDLPDDGSWDGKLESLTIDNIDSIALSVDVHTLYVRCKDQDGNWGKINQCVFEISKPLIIRAAEWVTDPDTTPGQGNPLKPADGAFDSAEEEFISDSLRYDAFPTDTIIYIRVQDNLNFNVDYAEGDPDPTVRGRWSSNNGWRQEAQIVINPSQPLPTPTPTVTPEPSEPTPTPTVPVVLPTPTSIPSDPNATEFLATLVKTLDCGEDTLSESSWIEVPGGFEDRSPGIVQSGVSISSDFVPSSADNKGIEFVLNAGDVSMIVASESVNCVDDLILMKAHLHSNGPSAQIVLGALKGTFTTGENLDGSLAMNLARSSASCEIEEGVVWLLYKPDSGETLSPFIQVSTDNLLGEKVWLDRIDIYQLKQK
jgi:hypothetical protein